MKILKWILFVGLALVALIVVVGFLLPDEYEVRRTVQIDASPERVFPLIHDFEHFEEWSPYRELDPDIRIEISEPSYGEGAVYRWVSESQGAGVMEIVAVEPGTRVTHELRFAGSEEYPSNSEFFVEPFGEGSTVTWRFYGDFGGNPIARYFGLLFESMVGEAYELGLENLKAMAEAEDDGGEG